MNLLTLRIVTGIAICSTTYLGYLNWRFRKNISKVFERNQFINPTLDEVNVALQTINETPSRFYFTANQVVNLLFRDHHVCLIDGPVYFSGSGKSALNSTRCVYALAFPEQKQWMEDNSDAFQLALTTEKFTIFWITLSKFKA